MLAKDLLAVLPTPSRRGRGVVHTKQEVNDEKPCSSDAPKCEEHAILAVSTPEEPVATVISIRKSSKGCAVVWLADKEVLERSLLQRVAVVDGVCVELRPHTKAATDAMEDAVGAVFVAWGHRVERKATVTEEGLEAYFTSLRGLPRPDGLIPTPPFEEEFQSFQVQSSGFLRPFVTAYPDWQRPSAAKLLESPFCERHLVQGLWSAKDRLDAHWERPPPPLGRSLLLRVARAQLFPNSGDGGKEHENRAGDKLQELAEEVKLLEGLPPQSAFLDLCGGPGAWSQMLLAHPTAQFRGYGFTLRTDSSAREDWHAEEKDQWYPELMSRQDWTALWGVDGSGDLLKPGNIEHCCWQLSSEAVHLCVADGGFSDDCIPAHQQELYVYRLLLGELLMAASCLQPGGRFVCKLYSTFSEELAALLYAATCMFETVKVVKPTSSRATGPERYLVAFGFHREGNFATVYQALYTSHMRAGGHSPLVAPLLTPVLPQELILSDTAFVASMKLMTTALCQRQTAALQAVVDQADKLEELAFGDGEHGTPHWVVAEEKSSKTRPGKGSQKGRRAARGGA